MRVIQISFPNVLYLPIVTITITNEMTRHVGGEPDATIDSDTNSPARGRGSIYGYDQQIEYMFRPFRNRSNSLRVRGWDGLCLTIPTYGVRPIAFSPLSTLTVKATAVSQIRRSQLV